VDPWTHRQNLASLIRKEGHDAELFEDLSDREGEGLNEKLEREVASNRWAYILIYLPVNADTASINSEMTLLRQFLPRLPSGPRVLLWCQDSLLEDADGELAFRDPPMKSAYLRDFATRVRTTIINWDIHEDLYRRIAELAKDLA
jgi:hypothetical protein